MTSDPLLELWNSPENRPNAESAQQLAARFMTRLRRHRRWQAAWLAWTVIALTFVTGLAVKQFARLGPGGLAAEWSLIPLLALPWLITLHFVRGFLRSGSPRTESALPLRALLDVVRASHEAQGRRLRLVAWLFAVMTPVIALAVWQLRVAGKTTVDQAWSMALVFAAALAVGAGTIGFRYWRRLRPEQRAVETLIRDLDAPGR